ncbi:MAG: TetR family transcriptional regulator [Actinobacteria bacterium]|nr:TetR family transcriptional regulator [Actinomycetota bacterium]
MSDAGVPVTKRRGRPARADRENEAPVRDALLQTASELFAAHGYDGTSVNMLAKQVGISPAALYWHFENKEALLFALLTESMDEFDRAIDEISDDLPPEDQLRALATAHTRSMVERPKVKRAAGAGLSNGQLSGSLSPDRYQQFHQRVRRNIQKWRQVIERGVETGVFDVDDPGLVTTAVLSMCESTGSWFHAGGPLSADKLAAAYGDYALRLAGYRKRPRRRKSS